MSEGDYYVLAWDLDRRHPDETAYEGPYSTAEAAIAAVQARIDTDLEQLWSQICGSRYPHTLEELISWYEACAEKRNAFHNSSTIFDTTAYIKSRAAEIWSC